MPQNGHNKKLINHKFRESRQNCTSSENAEWILLSLERTSKIQTLTFQI